MSAPDIFLSYSRDDRAVAERVSHGLESEGFSVWWDAALHSGETFDEMIEHNLRRSKAVIVLWSPRSVGSRWVRAEATQGDRRKKLVPAMIEPCEMPIAFELHHTSDLSRWDGNRSDPDWLGLVTDVRRLVGFKRDQSHLSTPAPAASTPTPPPAEEAAPDDQTQFFTEASAPLEESELHVLEIAQSDGQVRKHVVGPLGIKIGRAAPADLVLSDPRVSRTHCLVEIKDDELEVSDLNSTNGTYIDDQRVEKTMRLPVGSELRIGKSRLVHELRPRADLLV